MSRTPPLELSGSYKNQDLGRLRSVECGGVWSFAFAPEVYLVRDPSFSDDLDYSSATSSYTTTSELLTTVSLCDLGDRNRRHRAWRIQRFYPNHADISLWTTRSPHLDLLGAMNVKYL
jgi:hypothetical protein